jgi:hypothetical protein
MTMKEMLQVALDLNHLEAMPKIPVLFMTTGKISNGSWPVLI